MINSEPIGRQRLDTFKQYLQFPGEAEFFCDLGSHLGISDAHRFGLDELKVIANSKPRSLANPLCQLRVHDAQSGRLLLEGNTRGYCTPAEIYKETADDWLEAASSTAFTDLNTVLFAFRLSNTSQKSRAFRLVLSGSVADPRAVRLYPVLAYYRREADAAAAQDPGAKKPVWPDDLRYGTEATELFQWGAVGLYSSLEPHPPAGGPWPRRARLLWDNTLLVHCIEPPTDDRDTEPFHAYYSLTPNFPIEKMAASAKMDWDEAMMSQGVEEYEGHEGMDYHLFSQEMALGPGESKSLHIGFTFALNDDTFYLHKTKTMTLIVNSWRKVDEVRRRWEDILARLPELQTDDEQLQRIYLQAIHTLWLNVVAPSPKFDGLSRHYGCFVSKFTNCGGWAMSVPFAVPAFAEFAPFIAEEIVYAFIDAQLFDGSNSPAFALQIRQREFSRTFLEPFRRFSEAVGDPWEANIATAYAEPPDVVWASWRLYERTHNKLFLRRAYPGLARNVQSFYRSCYIPADGLFRNRNYKAVDVPRPGELTHRLYLARDNGWILVALRALANIARELGLEEEAAQWRARADHLAESIVAIMYSPEDNLFYNTSVDTHEHKKYLELLTNFGPLWGGVPLDEERQQRMLRDYLLNPRHFYGPVPFPTVAFTEPQYKADGFYAGEMQVCSILPQLETLWMHGLQDEADEVAARVAAVMARQNIIYGGYRTDDGSGTIQPYSAWAAGVLVQMLLKRYRVAPWI